MKRWRLERLTHRKANADLDPATAFFVLTWDAFRAPAFAWDEALRLARAASLAAAGSDFEALYHLYRLAWSREIDEPDQLRFWRADGG